MNLDLFLYFLALSDGSQASLLNLIGTVPVVSQQNQGRAIEVPLEICLPLHFPMELPIIWIRPEFLTGDLKGSVVLRPTDNVDVNGMVWGIESLRGLRLIEIIVNLQSIFGYQLPIVSANISKSFMNNLNNVNYNHPQQQEIIHGQEYLGSTGGDSYSRERARSPQTQTVYSAAINSKVDNFNNGMSDNSFKLKKKVADELESKLNSFTEEYEKLLVKNSKLAEGENSLNREKMTLNNEINLLNKELDILESKRTELERFISNNSGNEIGQRSATIPADPASSQLLELLANECALMDALYQLIKVTVTPTNESRVPLNAALRCIRELSRKHFLTKAHIRKIIK